ncbi:MAG: hypothetical protein EXR76_15865 [Myxococcales bacterium]|nr:hypothetical protein [Myxococcales bacterium]
MGTRFPSLSPFIGLAWVLALVGPPQEAAALPAGFIQEDLGVSRSARNPTALTTTDVVIGDAAH